MSNTTNSHFSRYDIRQLEYFLIAKIEEDLKEETLSNDLQEITRHSILEKDMHVKCHDHTVQASLPPTCGRDKISDHLLLASHIFLDRHLKGSSLEGANIAKVTQALISACKSIERGGEDVSKIQRSLHQLNMITSRLINDCTMPKKEIVEYIKDNILKTKLSSMLSTDEFQLACQSIDSPAISDQIEQLITPDLVSFSFLKEHKTSILDKSSNLVLNDIKQRSNSDPSFSTVTEKLKNLSLWGANFDTITYLKRVRKLNEGVIKDIADAIKNLQESETFSLPSTYSYNKSKAHATITMIEKCADETYNLMIFNTGDGTENHTLTQSRALSQESHKFTAVKRMEIDPVIKYCAIPAHVLLVEKDGSYLLLQFLTDIGSHPFVFWLGADDPNQLSSLFYNMIDHYLSSYRKPIDSPLSMTCYPQQSGTCVWNSIKTMIRYLLPKETYTQFTLKLKMQILKNAYESLSLESIQTDVSQKMNLLHMCASSFMTALEEKGEKSSDGTYTYLQALGTAADLIGRCQAFARRQSLLCSQRQRADAIFENKSCTAFRSVEQIKTILDEASRRHISPVRDRYEPTPIQQLEKGNIIFSSFANMASDLTVLVSLTVEVDSVISYGLITQYIDSIDLNAKGIETIEDPKQVLNDIFYLLEFSDDKECKNDLNTPFWHNESRFLRSWKIFLLGVELLEQIQPSLLASFPLDCFGFTKNNPPMHFLIPTATLQKNLQMCIEKIEKHNSSADSSFKLPLFSSITNLHLPLAQDGTSLLEKNATVSLCEKLLKCSNDLHSKVVTNFLEFIKKYMSQVGNTAHPCYEPTQLELALILLGGYPNNSFSPEHQYFLCLLKLYLRSLKYIQPSINLNQSIKLTKDVKNNVFITTCPSKTSSSGREIFQSIQAIKDETINVISAVQKGHLWHLNRREELAGKSSNEKEAIFIKNHEYIALALPKMGQVPGGLDFMKDLLVASEDFPNLFFRVFDLLLNPKNSHLLSERMVIEVVKNIMFAASEHNPYATALFDSLKDSESLRKNCEKLFEVELERIARQEHKDEHRTHFILDSILLIKQHLQDLPFVPDFSFELKRLAWIDSEVIRSKQLDDLILFASDKGSDERFVEIVSLSLKIKNLSLTQQHFLLSYLSANRALLQKETNLTEIGSAANLQPPLVLDDQWPILWSLSQEIADGIDLFSHNRLHKTQEGEISRAAIDDLYLSSHPLLTDIAAAFVSIKTYGGDKKLTANCEAGEFTFENTASETEEEDNEYKLTYVSYIPSESFQERLPINYRSLRWQYVLHKLCDLSVLPAFSKDFEINYISEEERCYFDEHLEFFSFLPLASKNILHIYTAQESETTLVLCANREHKLTYLVEINSDDGSLRMHDLCSGAILSPAEHSSIIKRNLTDMQCYKKIDKWESGHWVLDATGRSFFFKDSFSTFCVNYNDTTYQFSGTSHPHFPFSHHILAFTSLNNPEKNLIILSGSAPLAFARTVWPEESCPLIPIAHIFAFEILNGKIIPITFADELFLNVLKISNRSEDRFAQIHKLDQLLEAQSADKNIIETARDFFKTIAKHFKHAQTAKDELCQFGLHLAAFLLKNGDKTVLAEDFRNMHNYHREYSQINHRYAISIDKESIITESIEWSYGKKFTTYHPYIKLLQTPSRHFIANNIFSYKRSLYFSLESAGNKTPSLYTESVSIKEILRCIENNDYKSFHEHFFILLHKFILEKDQSYINMLMLCLCLDPSVANTFSLHSSSFEEDLVKNDVLSLKNQAYFTEFLRKKLVISSQFLQKNDIEKIFLKHSNSELIPSDRRERKTQFLIKTNANQYTFYQASLGVSFALASLGATAQQVQEVAKQFFSDLANIRQSSLGKRQLSPIATSSQAITPFFAATAQPSQERVWNAHLFSQEDTEHHIKIFLASLDSLIEDKEKGINTQLRWMASENSIRRVACNHSQRYHPPTFDELIYLLLEGREVTYRFFLGTVAAGLSQDDRIKPDSMLQLHTQTADLLYLKICRRKLEAMSQRLFYTDSSEPLDIMAQIQKMDLTYSQENIHWLAFEYMTGFDLRPRQKKLLYALERKTEEGYTSQVAQMMMGEGKSSVLLPLLIFSSTGSNDISIVLCLKEHIPSMISQLQKSQGSLFEQKVIPLVLKRQELSIEKLVKLSQQLQEAQQNRSVFITTPETMQTLELEFIDSLRQVSGKQPILIKILSLIRTYGNCLADEYAHIADVSKLTNFPLMSTEKNERNIPKEHIELIKEMFVFLFTQKGSGYKKIQNNEQIYLLDEELQLISSELKEFACAYLTEKFSPQFSSEFIRKIFEREKISLQMSAQLKEKDLPEDKRGDLIALAHLFIFTLLPKVCMQCGLRNYGRSIQRGKEEKIIPYSGVSSPASTEFSFPYETLCYHFLYAGQFGQDTEQLQAIADRIYTQALEQSKALMTPIEQTAEALWLRSMAGIEIHNCFSEHALQSAKKHLDTLRCEGEIRAVFSLEAFSAAEHITSFSQYLSSNAHDLLWQYKTVRGLTGTPWNRDSWSLHMADHLLEDVEVENKIITTFCKKKSPLAQGHFAYVTDEKNIKAILSHLLSDLAEAERENLSAFIDTGALLKEFQNQQVAYEILEVLKDRDREAQMLSVIFFTSTKNSSLPDVPHVLQYVKETGRSSLIELSDTNRSTMKNHGILDHPYFVYYDDRHTTGTDIPLPKDAIALITIDRKTPLYRFTQGLLRARGYFLEQKVITVIPQHLQEINSQVSISPQNLLDFLQKNEKDLLLPQIIRSFHMQLESTCRRFVLDHLIGYKMLKNEDKPIKPAILLHHFKDLFIKNDNHNLIDLITEKKERYNPVQDLENKTLELISRWQNIGLCTEDFTQIQQALMAILQRGKEKIGLSSYPLDNESLFQQVFIERSEERQLENQLDQVLEQEMSALQTGSDELMHITHPLPVEDIINHYKWQTDEPFISDTLSIRSISRIITQQPITPYQIGLEKILFTSNVLYDGIDPVNFLFGNKKTKLCSILIIESDDEAYGEPTMISLNYSETKTALDYLRTHQTDGVFLVNTHGYLMSDSDESLHLTYLKDMLHNVLIETSIVNLDIQMLSHWPKATYEWLNPSEDPLGKIRMRHINLVCKMTNKPELLSFAQKLKQGAFIDRLGLKEKIAKQQIENAERALANKDLSQVEKQLLDYPLDQLAKVPNSLCPFMLKRYFSRFTRLEQIASLADRHRIHLLSGQKALLALIPSMKKLMEKDVFAEKRKAQEQEINPIRPAYYAELHPHQLDKGVGFKNYGNTCYINASLKAIFKCGIIETMQDFLETDEGTISKILIDLYAKYKTGRGNFDKELQDLIFHNSIGKSQFPLGQMHDAEEFCRLIFQHLHLNESPHYAMNFIGQMAAITIANLPEEPAVHVVNVIQEILKTCSHNDPSSFQIMTVQLARFNRAAVKNEVEVQNILDPFITLIPCKDTLVPIELDLQALVCHFGTLERGHYVCITKDEDGYLLHNDEKVEKISKEIAQKFAEKNGYILFYKPKVLG